MSRDIGVDYLRIRDELTRKHNFFLNRFGCAVEKHIGHDMLVMTRILAKLKLVAKALQHSGAINIAEEVDIKSKDGDFPMSIRISKEGSQHWVYLLNDGKNVIVSGSVGAGLVSGTMSGQVALALDESKVCRKFTGVLADEFDWLEMCSFIMDAIHEVVYSKHAVIMETLLKEGTGEA